jgi:hypothetical protein
VAEGGYDTANLIQNVYSKADSKYGTPAYWVRYFSPAPNTPINSSSSNANTECRADWDSLAKHLIPITSPLQSRLSGISAEGLADAQAFVSALVNVWLWVIPLRLPVNGFLRCWLDQEASTSMSTAYWSGWSGYINTYNWEGQGFYPLFACLYCNPCGGAGHNCTTVQSAHGCYAIWSNEPESPYCGYSLKNLPAWHANSCSSCASNAPSTDFWQFAEQVVCNLTVNVDMDEGTLTPYSFYLSARP